MNIEIFDRQSIKNTPLFKNIIELDIDNMREVFEHSETGHPVEKRKKSFDYPGVLITAFVSDGLAGYLEYGPCWDNPDNIYISSIQIKPEYRNTKLFAELLRTAKKDLVRKNFKNIISAVQKTNFNAIKIFRKLGFLIEEKENNPKSYRLIGTKDKILHWDVKSNNELNKLIF